MNAYNPQEIEEKWQKYWEKKKIFEAEDFSKKEKFYCLDMFPYPSGDGLHVGHPRGYVATDIISNFMRLRGYDVLHPMGWDAFGLPAENYAIKTGTHPSISTQENIERFKTQMKSIGFSYDWSREVNTTDPIYYKWTQWIFLQLFKKGLAYEAELPINWCPSCKTGLANEEVVGSKCDRCGSEVAKKNVRQWVLKITAYADRLLEDLKDLDWPEKIITMQKNWIGRSEGVQFEMKIKDSSFKIEVFTTRIDTVFGMTYAVIAPEHPILQELKSKIENWNEIERYIKESEKKDEIERASLEKEKTGMKAEGVNLINPFNSEVIPLLVGDYVLGHYGTGVVMAVPAHDERDFEFAKKYKLPIKKVVLPEPLLFIPRNADDIAMGLPRDIRVEAECFVEDGELINSGNYNGLKSDKAREGMTKWLEKNKIGYKKINYKLRDWIFSRQRYWGEPIPIVHCEKCGAVPLFEKELPLKLPKVEKYQPTGTGESPLAEIKDWVNIKCPKCKGPAKRETNTMPQWAGSCWYFLRYIDSKNNKQIFDPKKLKYWLPVDLYVGGAEHAVLHLLYSRFWIKVLHDEGIVHFNEPFLKLRNQGLIMAPDGQKMSKSRGNVINPDDVIKQYGADTLRLYEMFIGPFEDSISWDTKGIEGCARFLKRFWNFTSNNLNSEIKEDKKENQKLVNKLIKKITEDITEFKFNTSVSSFMEFLNNIEKEKVSKLFLEKILILLAPFTPHISEELWNAIGNKNSILKSVWPEHDPKLIKDEIINLIVQINGKMRDSIEVEADISEGKAKDLALARNNVKKWTEGKEIKKVIFVPGRIINIVI